MNVYEVLTIGVKDITATKKVKLGVGGGCLVFTDENDKKKIDQGVKEAIAPDDEASSREITIRKSGASIIIVNPVSLDTVASNLRLILNAIKP